MRKVKKYNNSLKNGFQNETSFIKNLNNKILKDIDFSLQLFLEDLFPNIKSNDLIKCYKNDELQKYDIFIKINTMIRRISIKKGVKNSVHSEPITEMIHFLIENKMPRNLVLEFLKYHYADGTTNGSGNHRLSAMQYKEEHQKEIDKINEFINNEEILVKAIDRFIIKGRNSDEKIDAIIYGVPDDFIWIKREDIYKILLGKKDGYSSCIHFSSLTYQPMDRCLNHNLKYEKCRYISQIKWYNISDDIIENMNDNIELIG